MKKHIIIIAIFVAIVGFFAIFPLSNYKSTTKLYNKLISGDPNIAQLNLFLTKMPKGGDLHHHYSGTIYAETYLDWVKKKKLKINECSLKIVKEQKKEKCKVLTVDELRTHKNSTLYRKLLTVWSNKDYKNHDHPQLAPDASFFSTFEYFVEISDSYNDIGLNILKQRAVKENISYIETMIDRVGVRSEKYFNSDNITNFNKLLRETRTQKELNLVLDEISAEFLKNDKFITQVKDFIERIESNHQAIDDESFTMRYQTYALRVLDPIQVFSDLFSGYLAANESSLIVGVNIVAPENNEIALQDYTLHMRMYNYLLNKYPTVGRSLHSGELTLGMVRPKDLTFHIKQARDIAQAQRIGHGIDLPYEQGSLKLLQDLKENSVIEINLTSAEFILGVSGQSHPYLIYADYGVPIVISTDDSGVSRNNLSYEYMLLASRYKPTYKELKKYVYNSIKYSFLTKEKKAHITLDLDKRFKIFESEMTELYNNISSN